VQFIDLEAQQARIRTGVDAALARVLDHGRFILGPEVGRLEEELAGFCGAAHVVSCASGTDALVMALMARGVGAGDAVIVPSFTFAATAESVALLGATPVFVDVDDRSFNLDPAAVAAAFEEGAPGCRTVGIIAVDLFGQPADYAAIGAAAAAHGAWVIADAAQSFGASRDGVGVGRLAPLTTTSFFPAKPLGCYGDGGAVFAESADDDMVLRSVRVHGSGTDKYDNTRIGINGRLDTLQAAVLLEKLRIFTDELAARQRVADRYTDRLTAHAGERVVTPGLEDGCTSAWAQYTMRVDDRDEVAARLRSEGIPTAVYYPRPLHQQTAYRDFPCGPGGLPVSERLADEVLSLPMHPYLTEADQDRVVAAVAAAVGR
jgi:dTDP-4-amino-4,6-dideoxygalactose transaminase